MIILDTNVLSALMQDDPPEVVIRWLDRQPRMSVCSTVVTLFEIEHGLGRLPGGKRKKRLQSAFAILVETCLEGRFLPFDIEAAIEAGALAARADAAGRTIGIRDLQIAGIAAATNATVATRNTKDFWLNAKPVVNPWEDD